MPAYPREELETMVERWLEANRKAEETKDWRTHLGALYTEDAEYRWNVGPQEEFYARGKQQIQDWALGVQMEGFEGWSYPYDKILIDEKQGEVVGFWRQVAPVPRPDGSPYEVAGVGGSWFRYGGDGLWCWQRDFFDFGNVVALLGEMASAGVLDKAVRDKLHRVARGQGLPGHEKIGPKGNPMLQKLRGGLALARIAILG